MPHTPDDIFDSQLTFTNLGLHKPVLQGVLDAGFEKPTHIQAKLIPAILAGKDVIGQAKTGTGKTAAFGLPILHLAEPDVFFQALILVPTRELASQVAGEINELGRHTRLHAVCVIGGESIRDQSRALKKGAHLLVGTPGRVMDMQGRGEIHFQNIRFVVLDEVDRMLDIGFREDIRKILSTVRREHQTIFVSATISKEIELLARRFMKPDTEKIITLSGALTVSLVDQKHLPVEPWDKKQLLYHLLKHEKPDTTVVFCRTKQTVHKVTAFLKDKGINAREIHGDLSQSRRNKVMVSLRQGNLDVLVASDLAARGLDVEHISHVINYDLPDDPEVYVHRIGRTARAGKRGVAWAFVTSNRGSCYGNRKTYRRGNSQDGIPRFHTRPAARRCRPSAFPSTSAEIPEPHPVPGGSGCHDARQYGIITRRNPAQVPQRHRSQSSPTLGPGQAFPLPAVNPSSHGFIPRCADVFLLCG
ncbi:MAG: DEAD/DEAH box helicase [Phycisphaerales bacterium]|nr:DEAD/DEAH box helicase [Phycisphaerales bacterium]